VGALLRGPAVGCTPQSWAAGVGLRGLFPYHKAKLGCSCPRGLVPGAAVCSLSALPRQLFWRGARGLCGTLACWIPAPVQLRLSRRRRREGRQGVAAPLLYRYFILLPAEKNADIISPAVSSSQKMKRW